MFVVHKCLRHSNFAAAAVQGSPRTRPVTAVLIHVSNIEAVASPAVVPPSLRAALRAMSSKAQPADEEPIRSGDGGKVQTPAGRHGEDADVPSTDNGLNAASASTKDSTSESIPAAETTNKKKETYAERDARLMALFADREGGAASYGSIEGDRLYGGMGSQTKRNMFRVI
ncbi:unnamed protein product [Tilletia controversa]|uniref:Uncharacterized protein n=2 Tax=Tilletia TaxID=13289 RepID=A0A177VFN7_9BASI|nr:hypothetical protein CF336_g264 [Tilletia laevis]KAE8265489.1 hypothetical protein A4X03_0g230 [Tilletia caries]CAD6903301.1 unnamed protein product [Tilletia controversa]KAE8208741.1 hypothetical protein CF335_g191 [Tilletia laevis]CAD6887536.1 unnamed protein product [Tilletia caries]